MLQHSLQERYREVVTEHRRLLEDGDRVQRRPRRRPADGVLLRGLPADARCRDRSVRRADLHRRPASGLTERRSRCGWGSTPGNPELEGDRYVGLAVARAARIGATAHGGQVIMSGTARGLLDGRLSAVARSARTH